MQDPIEIRRLAPSDSLEELTALLHRAYASLAARGMRFTASHQSVEVTRRRIADRECYVAACEGRLVGTVTLSPPGVKLVEDSPAWYREPGVAFVLQLGVEPERRRRGLGGRLLTHAEQRAAQLGAREIALDTSENATELIAWYLSRGYRPVGRADWRPHVNYESVVLSKGL